ncbi:MAG TPA: NUDIX hydrolase [Candidatus Moranbacteria bacterium]|nr:NUDIX hydrolase [Candidatus Moranbacteria bacterium]HRY28127.1 NUDIX hydrolase [Candidatus Moranbacteria bacterium]HSA08441.1 NUDIX hydrolase [Candidatus Moranbacteria bacterium]
MNKIIIVSGPVIVKDNKVLLDKDCKDDFWKFCGGKVKEDEGLVDTAIRRSREELGIDIELLDEIPYMNFTKKETGDESIDVVLAHFLAGAVGEIKPGADIREWKWIPLSELKNEPLAPNIIPTLKHFGFIK